MPPETRYAKSGGVNVAYQLVGEGAVDLVYVPGWVSHVEFAWDLPDLAAGFERMASFSRVILFDKRGTGMSDPVPPSELPTLEQRMDDVRAVMDAVGSERAAIFGASEGGNMSMLFAATYPGRTVALATFGCTAKRIRSPDYPWAPTWEARLHAIEHVQRQWTRGLDWEDVAPSLDERSLAELSRYYRRSASPGAALALIRMNTHVDVRDVLPTIRVGELGDQRWAELLARHHATVRRELERFRGRELDTAGDGFLASFDGPGRGVRCAVACVDAVREVGLEIRAGVHTGEVELMDGDI